MEKTYIDICENFIFRLFRRCYAYLDVLENDEFMIDNILINNSVKAHWDKKTWHCSINPKYVICVIYVPNRFSQIMENVVFPTLDNKLCIKHGKEYTKIKTEILNHFNKFNEENK